MSWGDAGILNSIQNGLAMFKDKLYIPGSSPYSAKADTAWKAYFVSFQKTGSSNETLQKWGAAEGAGTTYGRWLAQEHGATKSPGEVKFLAIGSWYRDSLKVRQDPTMWTGPQWSADFYGWLFDTSSTIKVPYTNIDSGVTPVSLVAVVLLQK